MAIVLLATPVLAELPDDVTSATVVESSEIVTSGSDTESAVSETSATVAVDSSNESPDNDHLKADEIVTPLVGVKPLQMGKIWQERFRSLGIPPESFWVAKPTPESQEEKDMMMASRHYFMGWYYFELNQAGKAIEEFSNALKFDPENSHILLDAARARLAVKEFAEARELITKVLNQETTNVEALRLQSDSFLAAADVAQGDEKENLLNSAVESLEKAHNIAPKNLEVLRGLAKAYVQQQNVEKVISTYREIVKIDPRDTYSLLILAQVLSRMDRPREAIEYYQRVIEQRRGFIGGYIYLGQLYEKLRQYDDALDLYKQALLVDPRNVDVLRRFEDLVRQQKGKDEDKIIAEYRKYTEAYPANTEVRRIYAERLEAAKRLNDAIVQYAQILTIDPENSDALVSLGKIYTDKNDYEKAAEYLNKAVRINPDRVELYDAIANTYLARNNKDEAIATYRKALETNSTGEKLYVSLAALLENDKQTTEAINVMEQAVKNVGEKPELLAVLGKFYRSQGRTELAERTLKRAYEMESDNLPLYGELMSLYLEQGNNSAAEAITSRTSSGSSVAKDVVLSVAAEFYVNAGRPDKAIELYLEALDINPFKFEYLGRLVGISNRQKNFSESLQFIDKFGSRLKEQERVQQLKAEVYLSSEQYEKAIAIYRELLRKNALNLEYYQYIIDAYNSAEQYDESLKLIKEAQAKFSDKPEEIMMMTGMVYYKSKKYDKAEKTFKDLIKRTNGKTDDAYYFLGSVYLEQDRYDEAEKQFRKAIDINPNSANALNALGFMYADRAIKLDEAEKLISEALEINPSAPHILDSMGWVLFKKGDLEGAQSYVERASRQFEDSEIFDHLGQIYASQGKNELAREMFKRALELDPKLSEVKKRLESLPQ